jgi:hypothetical protein
MGSDYILEKKIKEENLNGVEIERFEKQIKDS